MRLSPSPWIVRSSTFPSNLYSHSNANFLIPATISNVLLEKFNLQYSCCSKNCLRSRYSLKLIQLHRRQSVYFAIFERLVHVHHAPSTRYSQRRYQQRFQVGQIESLVGFGQLGYTKLGSFDVALFEFWVFTKAPFEIGGWNEHSRGVFGGTTTYELSTG